MQAYDRIQSQVWEALEATRHPSRFVRALHTGIAALIVANVAAAIFGTVQSIQQRYGAALETFELFSVAVFSAEYLLRLWSAPSAPALAGRRLPRLRHALSLLALIDLISIVPFYLPMVTQDLRMLRLFRLVRVARVLRLARYERSILRLTRVLDERRQEFVAGGVLMFMLMIVTASLMYYAENEAQPDKFTDIPTSMWWAIMTLTTVGYGDVYPVTTMGRVLGAVCAMAGIGLFALPAGILGSGLVEEIQRERAGRPPAARCPHCGEALEAEKD